MNIRAWLVEKMAPKTLRGEFDFLMATELMNPGQFVLRFGRNALPSSRESATHVVSSYIQKREYAWFLKLKD